MLQQRRRRGEGRAGVLPADALLPDPGRRPRHRVPDADLRRVARYAGQSISNAFFWAINRSQDATFFHDWLFSRGNGHRRRVPLHARRRRRRATSATTGSTRRKRSSTAQPQPAAAEHADHRRPQPGPAVRPDGARPRRLLHRRHGAAALQPQLLQRLAQHAHVSTAASRARGAACQRNGQLPAHRDVHQPTDSTVTGQTPGVTAAFSGRKLGPLPLFALGQRRGRPQRALHPASRRRPIDDLSLIKADFAAVAARAAQHAAVPAGQRHGVVSHDLLQREPRRRQEDADRRAGHAHATPTCAPTSIGPVFSQVFNPEQRDRRSPEARHRAVVLGAAPHRDRQPGPHPDTSAAATTRSSAASTQMTYGLTNRVLVRKDAGEASRRPARRASCSTCRSGRATTPTRRASQFDPSYSYGYQLPAAEPVLADLADGARDADARRSAIDFRLEYDPTRDADSPKLLGFGLNGTLRIADRRTPRPAGAARRLRQQPRRRAASTNYLQSGHVADVPRRASSAAPCRSTTTSRGRRSSTSATSPTTTRSAAASQFEYQAFNYPEHDQLPDAKDRRFNMSFTLAGVGSFSNFFGAFGGGTY